LLAPPFAYCSLILEQESHFEEAEDGYYDDHVGPADDGSTYAHLRVDAVWLVFDATDVISIARMRLSGAGRSRDCG